MKIGISCYPTFGGSGVVASELGLGLAERGHEVHFITYAVPGRLNVYRQGVFFHEVKVPDYPLFEYPPYSLALASSMAECAKYAGLSLMHAHYAIPHAASALLAREILQGRMKVATTLHGTDVTLVGRSPSLKPVTLHAIERSNAVSAVSMYLRDQVCCTFTCDRHVEVIYNFIDPRDYQGLDGARLRQTFAPNGEKLLLHVSNFRPVKRVRDVAEVFIRLRELFPVKLLLVGTGPDLPMVEQMARDHGADRDLIILGNRENVTEINSAADLMLLPSESESFGLAALEAMAACVPVIGCDSGGLPELIRNADTGFLTAVGDVDAMFEAARTILEDEHLRTSMGRRARQDAFDRFSLEIALNQYERFYQQALEEET